MKYDEMYQRLIPVIGNAYGVCAAIGGIRAESTGKANNVQNAYEKKIGMGDEVYTKAVDDGTYTKFATDSVGYGYCQWTSSGRKKNLLEFAKARGVSIGDEIMQLDFMIHELMTSYKAVFKVLQTATSVKEASDYFTKKYERPKDQSVEALERRSGYGEEFYREFVTEKEEKRMSKIIALDAGHGLKTLGKRCMKKLDPNETREWFLNDRIMDMVQADLEANYDCIVLRVGDTTGAKDISNSARAKAANNANAFMYVSMHHNAGLNGKNGGGTVVYYASSKPERLEQATELYNEIVGLTKLVGNRSQKVIKKNFTVIAKSNMPAFLVENGFMDSPTDVPIILSESHAIKTAQGVVNFLEMEFGIQRKSTETVKPSETVKPFEAVHTAYIVAKGDTLSKIGDKFGVDWRKIAEYNNLNAPYTIYANKTLLIPGVKQQESIYYPAYKGAKTTLVNALNSLGITSSYAYRKEIAKANNISLYVGTATQNTQIYNLLVAGILKKV